MEDKDLVGLVTETERREGWLPARRVTELLPDVTNVASVRRIAKRLGWPGRRRGGSKEYPLERVLLERRRRLALEESEPAEVAP